VHVVARALEDRTALLRDLSDQPGEPPLARADEIKRPPSHPRQERPIPRSRDFK
jgi:error-prone DNA polymerase